LSEDKSINKIFKHKLSFVNREGACSPYVNGIVRRDGSAAIILPTDENWLKDSLIVRYHKNPSETDEYVIKDYYQDRQRPIGSWLIKPLVVVF